MSLNLRSSLSKRSVNRKRIAASNAVYEATFPKGLAIYDLLSPIIEKADNEFELFNMIDRSGGSIIKQYRQVLTLTNSLLCRYYYDEEVRQEREYIRRYVDHYIGDKSIFNRADAIMAEMGY